eukprot:jgi/Chrpa1/14320/Chrysochromulina_OHIO_Genome00005617-RA
MKVAANKAIEAEQAAAVAVEAAGKIARERAAAEQVAADKAASALAAAEKAEQDERGAEAHKNRFAVPSAITIKMLVEYKRRVKNLVPKGIKYEDYFPPIVLSYASGRRPDDCEGSGPGVVYAMGLMEFFHERGLQCFSGLQVPPGVDWETFMLRLNGENGKREKPKVLIVLLTAALYQSKPCLKEIDAAIREEVPILPVRFEDKLPGKAEQWTNLKNSDWEMMKLRVQAKLNSLNNIPNPGTVLSEPSALIDIMAELPVPDGQVQKHGFALRALLPETDAPLLQSLEALLKTEPSEELGTGRDVSKKYGKYDSLKLACAWKVDHPRNLARYTTGMKRVQEELKLLEQKGKDVSNVLGLPVKTARVGGFTLSEACNEVILLHGVNPGRLLALLSTGLNERYSGSGAGTAFGDGVYLAEDAGKTDQYVSPDSAYDPSSELHKWLYSETVPHPEDVLYVLVVRAALGFPVRTQRTLDNSKKAKHSHDLRAGRVKSMDDGTPIFPVNCRELPAVPGVTPPICCHHSLIAELGQDIVRYREFVLFHGDYVHVDYVIAYHRYNGDQKLRMTDSMTDSITDSPA